MKSERRQVGGRYLARARGAFRRRDLRPGLRAKRNINTEVPALAASVKELRDRQSRFERELEQLRRAGTTSDPVVR